MPPPKYAPGWLRLLTMLFSRRIYIAHAPGTLGIFATSSCQIQVKNKKVFSSVPYGKSGPGYCITIIKREMRA